ncbi:MAG TPA: DUF2304 domain-containing protein [Bryobacteraceae bacterium]|nr:DUF2304 domain-containing protein [Bryobacteraceae bacterium]
MDRMLMVLGGFSAVLVIWVLASVRREHIRVEYSVSWLVAATVLVIVSFNRRLVEWMAEALQIQYPPLVVIVLMLGVFLVVLYRVSLRISELKDNNIALAQKLAILEYRQKSIHEAQRQHPETT